MVGKRVLRFENFVTEFAYITIGFFMNVSDMHFKAGIISKRCPTNVTPESYK